MSSVWLVLSNRSSVGLSYELWGRDGPVLRRDDLVLNILLICYCHIDYLLLSYWLSAIQYHSNLGRRKVSEKCFFKLTFLFRVLLFILWVRPLLFRVSKVRWPSGLRRQFKALVFGRGFESRPDHEKKGTALNFCTREGKVEREKARTP